MRRTSRMVTNYYKEWSEIINTLKVFQCICVWVPFNFSLCGDILDVHHYPMPAMNAFEAKMINVIGEYGGLAEVYCFFKVLGIKSSEDFYVSAPFWSVGVLID